MMASYKPAKLFIKSMLRRDLKVSEGYDVGVDVACGYMSMHKLFRTKRYVGIDMDAERIRCGLARNPYATGIVSTIEAIDRSVMGDFVVCVQVIGINKHFDNAKTMDCINKIIDIVSPGGALIINIGPRSKNYENEIDALLARKFGDIHKTVYGAFYSKTNYLVSLLIVGLMRVFPWVRIGSKRCCYWMCNQRRVRDQEV